MTTLNSTTQIGIPDNQKQGPSTVFVFGDQTTSLSGMTASVTRKRIIYVKRSIILSHKILNLCVFNPF